MKLSVQARAFMYAFIVLAGATGLHALTQWQCDDFPRFVAYGAMSLAASTLKVKLPGVTGTMSVNFLFVLIGITELSIGEALLIAAAAVTVQCYWHARVRPQIIQVAFNVASIGVAVTLSSTVLHASVLRNHVALPIALALAACTHFIANTFPIACIIALTERKPLRHTWKDCYLWSFAYYLLGATIAALFHYVAFTCGWETGLLVLPIVYTIYKAYRLYLGRLEDKTEHAEQIASLHLRTIEALALAIDAKDHTTHDHLRRVQTYAIEIGQELGLSNDEVQALRDAALLHDIGKLAVPEQIISKPCKLTP